MSYTKLSFKRKLIESITGNGQDHPALVNGIFLNTGVTKMKSLLKTKLTKDILKIYLEKSVVLHV